MPSWLDHLAMVFGYAFIVIVAVAWVWVVLEIARGWLRAHERQLDRLREDAFAEPAAAIVPLAHRSPPGVAPIGARRAPR